MKLKEYIEATRRTWNYQTPEKDLEHALLGVVSEVGELLNAYKKQVGYGQELNLTNVKEELGDIHFFLVRIIDQLDLTEHFIEFDETYEYFPFNQPNILLCNFSQDAGHLHVYGLGMKEFTDVQPCIEILLDYVFELANYYGWSREDIRKANIAKLYVRFPDKFSEDKALVRNIENEIKALEK